MKNILLPLLTLAALVLVGIFCSLHTDALCRDWTAQLQEADQSAQAEDWDSALEQLTALQEDWHKKQIWLRVTMRHQELEEAEALIQRCLFLAQEQDSADLRAAISDLDSQMERLAEGERLSLENIW